MKSDFSRLKPAVLIAGLATMVAGNALGQTAIGRQVGVAAGVTGPVQLVAAAPGARTAGRIVQSGEPIRIGDQIATGADGRLQIMLLDETVFTIGPNAALTIDEFVFDSKAGTGKLTANVARGAFRFVTGRIATNNPQDMLVKTPVGTMGIRGTVVGGWVSEDRARIVLLGPGSQNNAAERMGRVFVQGTAPDSDGVELRRPGFATEIVGRNGRPSAPFRMPQVEIESLINELSNPLTRAANTLRSGEGGDSETELAELAPAGGGSAGGDLTRLSGQHIVDFLRPLICSACDVVLAVVPDAAPAAPASPFGPRPVVPEIVTFRGAIEFPTATFSLVPVGAATSGGRYDVAAKFDFDRRTVSGELTVVYGATTDRLSFTGVIPTSLFSPASAPSLRAFSAAPSFGAILTPATLTTSPAPGTTAVPLFATGLRQGSDGWIDFRLMIEKSPATLAVDRLSNGVLVSSYSGATGGPFVPLAVGAGISKTDGTTVTLTAADRAKLVTDLGLKR